MVRGHVVLFPLPFQGHLSPMLQLADVLCGRGLAITILHTTFNAPDPAAHPEFGFVAVADGGMPDGKDGIGKILAINDAMEASGCVRDALAALEPRPACLVIDTTLPAAQKAVAELGLPTIVLHTGSAATVRLFRSYAMLDDKGYLPAQEHELDKPVKELAVGAVSSQRHACGTPAQRKPERPVFRPRDKSSGIRHCWHRTNQLFITMENDTRVHGLHRHGNTTPAQGSSMLTAEQPEEAE